MSNVCFMKKYVAITMSFLLLSIFINISIGLQNIVYIERNNKTIYVGGDGPGNFTKIQDAINNSASGDTIFLYSGTYFENIIIDKSIIIVGENRYTTIVNGSYKESTMTINSEGTTIFNLTITGGGRIDRNNPQSIFKAGIRITASNNIILNNIIRNNRLGISGVRVTNLTICNNTFLNDGITFTPYENDERPTIKIDYFIHKIENNIVNGKPLYYFKNSNDFIVQSDIGQLIAVNCSNVTLKYMNISNCDNGILMAYCTNCKIENSTISKNDGIWAFQSCNNIFQFNNLSNNILHGITLDYSSNNNIIQHNLISNNGIVGVMLEWYSKNNLITNNNLISNNLYNGYQVQSFKNKWESNYWDDWKGLNRSLFRFFPKLVYGSPIEKITWFMLPISIDWTPTKKPYNL